MKTAIEKLERIASLADAGTRNDLFQWIDENIQIVRYRCVVTNELIEYLDKDQLSLYQEHQIENALAEMGQSLKPYTISNAYSTDKGKTIDLTLFVLRDK